MLSVADALSIVLQQLPTLEPESVRFEEALRRVLAEDIVADADVPAFANSAMDGYAVRAQDVTAASQKNPVILPVVADVPAGHGVPVPLPAGAAARIMTGAPLPVGADAVIPMEETDGGILSPGAPVPKTVGVLQSTHAGRHVRPGGQDLRAGERALEAGTRLQPAHLGVLATLGRSAVGVVRRPRVATLASGDELVGIDEALTPGKIRDVNGVTLPALVRVHGGVPIPLGAMADQAEAVQAALDAASRHRPDLLITAGGVSAGAFDFIRDVVERHGRVHFSGVDMRPGKPVTFGEYRGMPFLGLPGNPASAMVTFEVFARPALWKMSGRRRLDRLSVLARLDERLVSDGRESYLRVVVERREDEFVARLAGDQGSGLVTTMARANALLIVPAGRREVAAGDRLVAWLLDGSDSHLGD